MDTTDTLIEQLRIAGLATTKAYIMKKLYAGVEEYRDVAIPTGQCHGAWDFSSLDTVILKPILICEVAS